MAERSRARSDGADEGQAEAQLLRQYEGALRKFIGRRVRSRDEIDDLVQEAFARLLASEQRRDVEYPVAYLFRIASNLLADHGRRRTASPVDDAIDGDERHFAVSPNQEDGRHLADLRASLDAALAQLSPKCRDVFIMRRFRGLSTPEVAGTLGITPRMVQKHMTHAMTHVYLCLRGGSSGARH